jgi:Mitochondrial carrier protein
VVWAVSRPFRKCSAILSRAKAIAGASGDWERHSSRFRPFGVSIVSGHRRWIITKRATDSKREEKESRLTRHFSLFPSLFLVPLYDDLKRHWIHQNPETNPALIHMSSAVLAGAISDVICNPMFVVRTRLQTEALHHLMDKSNDKHNNHNKPGVVSKSKPALNNSIAQTIVSLYREGGGPLIFWRGMTANLIGLSHVAVQFPVYEGLKKTLRGNKRHESAWDLLIASGLSKMTASLLTYPHEVVRSRMMDARVGMGLIATCQKIYAKEGFWGFYAGLPVSLIRVIPNTCITFIA